MDKSTQPFLRVAGVDHLAEIASVSEAGIRPDMRHLIAVVTFDEEVTGRIGVDAFNGEAFLWQAVREGRINWRVGLHGQTARMIAAKHDTDFGKEVIVVLELPANCPRTQGTEWPEQPPEPSSVPLGEYEPTPLEQASGFQLVSDSIPEVESMTVAGISPSDDLLVMIIRFKDRMFQQGRSFDAEAFLRRHYQAGHLVWRVGESQDPVRVIACAQHPDDPKDVYVVLEPHRGQLFFAGVDWDETQVTFDMIEEQGLPADTRQRFREPRTVSAWIYGRRMPQVMYFLPLYHPTTEQGGKTQSQPPGDVS